MFVKALDWGRIIYDNLEFLGDCPSELLEEDLSRRLDRGFFKP